MTNQQLEYLIAIEQYGSMKEAAKQLGITHAALSISIANLEKELNTQLVNRAHSGCSLSEAGNEVFLIAQRIQQKLKRFEGLKNDSKMRRSIQYSCSSAALGQILYQLNHKFLQINPNAEIQFQRSASGVVNMWNKNVIDLCFFTSFSDAENAIPLFRSQYTCLLSRQHPLSHLASISLQDEGKKYPLLIYSEGEAFMLPQYLQRYGQFFSSMDTVRTLLNDNQCIALVPQVFTSGRYQFSNQNVQEIPCGDSSLQLYGFVQHNPEKTTSQLQKTYITFLQEQFQLFFTEG